MEVFVEDPIQDTRVSIYTGEIVSNSNKNSKNNELIIFQLLEYDDLKILFNKDELTEFIEGDLSVNGRMGNCEVCGRTAKSSKLLDLENLFYTFCEECYTDIEQEIEKAYDRHRTEIVSQLL